MVLVSIENFVQEFFELTQNSLVWFTFFLVTLDIFTGLIKALVNQNLNSSINLKGIGKHVTTIVCILTVYPLVSMVGFDSIANIFLTYVIIAYAISFVENLGEIGFPLPVWAKGKLEKLKQNIDENEGEGI